MENMNMTKGVIWRKILFFTLPLLGSSFIQQLYNTVDLIFVGNFLGKEAAAAVGASTLFVTCLVGFFSGMSVGSSVVTSMALGSNDKKRLQSVIHSAIGIGFVCGIIIMFIGVICAPYFLDLINTPIEIRSLAISYIRVYFISIISIVTYNMGAGIIRAMGNSKTPMYIQLVGGIVNVIMNAFFILVLKKGVVGVAFATFFSQTIAAGLVLNHLMNIDSEYRLEVKRLRIYKEHFYSIVKIGMPVGLQALVITLSNVFVQYYVNRLGVDALASFTAYFKVELLIYLPIMAFGQAITTFTSQNIGAGEFLRVKKGTKICLLMGGAVTLVLSLCLMVFGRQVFSIISRDPGVLDLGVKIISITVPFYWLYLILEVLGGSIRGSGKTIPPMVIILTNICLLRSILLFVIMSYSQNIQGMAITYPITWGSTAICMAIYYYKTNWIGEAHLK